MRPVCSVGISLTITANAIRGVEQEPLAARPFHRNAKETLREVLGAVKNFEPAVRFHTFDDSSINFSVVLRITDFEQNFIVKHEFIKRLHKRYAKEGIVIPYPIRAVNYEQEKASPKA